MKLVELLRYPQELVPLCQLAYAMKFSTKVVSKDPNIAFCYDMLRRVSRSFALVIQQLPQPLRDAVCVFYLVLRALDTVEDDMAIPNATKVPLLRTFHQKATDRSFQCSYGTGHYKNLMQEYPRVTAVLLGLDKHFQEVILDITNRMGNGMADYIDKEVVTVPDYDEYCHYVAGLVGIGLSQLFSASGRESPDLAKQEDLANHMGLFLQKTNIIRDYLEDINEEPAPRMFWPREVWSRYGKQLDDFKQPGNAANAVACLDDLICDALRHAPHCLKYCAMLQDPHIFKFCALPQLMAAGTLAACFDNHRVFTGVVKMRRGETARLTSQLSSMVDVCKGFRFFFAQIRRKARSGACQASTQVVHLVQERVETVDKMACAMLQKAGVHTGTEKGTYPSPMLHYLLLALSVLYLFYTLFRDSLAPLLAHVGISDGVAIGQPGVDVVNVVLALTMITASLGMLLGLLGKSSKQQPVPMGGLM